MSRGSKSVVAAVLLLAAVGCNGPKDSCEGTMESYRGCINNQDWDGMVALMNPTERKKYGDRKLYNMFGGNWIGVHSMKWTFMQADTAKAGDICVARTSASWTVKVRGAKAQDITGYGDVFTLHPVDGLWYIDVPGSQKIQGY